MNIRIICVGKLKEPFWKQACLEYEKRLARYCTLEVVEVADESTPETLSEKQRQAALKREGDRILRALKPGKTIAMDLQGRQMDSMDFSKRVASYEQSGVPTLHFVIGGSLGLSDEVYQAADERISFSKLTFPHNLFRVLLLEQLYRAQKILRNEPYHK